MKLSKQEKKLLIEVICNEQTNMIIKDHSKYSSKRYKALEELKIKIKDSQEEMVWYILDTQHAIFQADYVGCVLLLYVYRGDMMILNNLYVDFDGVIVDTIRAIVDLYNEDFQYYKKYKVVDPKQINT